MFIKKPTIFTPLSLSPSSHFAPIPLSSPLFLKTLISHMDINQQTHLWNDIITHHQPPPPPSDQSRHHESSTTSFPPFHHHFPPSSFLSSQAENQERECNEERGGGGDQEAAEDEEEELGAMKEMMYRMAAMQSVEIDPASIRKPRRRNVRISDDPQSVAARHRRERISEKIRILQRLVPGGTKLDTASMLEEAVRYVKFLKRQIRLLQTTATVDNNGNSIGTTISAPSRIITRSIGSGTEGLDGFGVFEIGAVTTGGVQEGVDVGVGGGADPHRLVCFDNREVISDP